MQENDLKFLPHPELGIRPFFAFVNILSLASCGRLFTLLYFTLRYFTLLYPGSCGRLHTVESRACCQPCHSDIPGCHAARAMIVFVSDMFMRECFPRLFSDLLIKIPRPGSSIFNDFLPFVQIFIDLLLLVKGLEVSNPPPLSIGMQHHPPEF